ncbi:hypothetical protein [Methylocystis sp. S23]
MRAVIMTLSLLGAIGSGLYAILAWFAAANSNAQTSLWMLQDAKTAGWTCLICAIVFLVAWRG